VFKNENPVFFEDALTENKVGNLRQIWQRIGRVGEDEVELLVATLQEAEYVAADRDDGRGDAVVAAGELLQTLPDEVEVVAVGLYAYYLLTASGEEFEGDAAGAGEEIEGAGVIEVDVSVEDIKDVFLGEVGSRTCLEGTRDVEMSTFVFPCDNAHRLYYFFRNNVMRS